MLKDVAWAEDGTYKPQGDHKPLEFFNFALKNSYVFDLELGYFNSAAISVLAYSFASFIKNHGKMRMAINNIVSKQDKDAISQGKQENPIETFDLENLSELRRSLDGYGEHFFNCLSYLIHENRIEICIIKPRETDGMAHTKKGQFSDGETIVSFTGSANFTLGGFFNNREEISISFDSSPDQTIQKRIENQKKEFDQLMSGLAEDVEYLDVSDLKEAIASEFGNPDIDDLINAEHKLRQYKYTDDINTMEVNEDDPVEEPRFPYPSGPRDYQIEAFENWKANGQKGLFAMATGTGKTLTALNVLLNIYKSKKYYKALIVVPTVTLVEQWEKECLKFNFNRIVKICTKNTKWREQIENLNFQINHSKTENEISFVIITTYASFTRPSVFKILNSYSKSQVLFMADEAHNMGAPGILKRLKDIVYYRRIGLSATPERQYEDATNIKLFKFFGAEDNYTYEYSMENAIRNGVLCKYLYYPHIVELTESEMEKYENYSVKIAKYFNFNSQSFDKKDDILMNLLLARKRLIHKAGNKLSVFTQIVKERFQQKGSLKYTLVYVPEGNRVDDEDADLFESIETVEPDIDSDHIIDIYTKAIVEIDPRVTVKKFTGDSVDRDSVLSSFAEGSLQVLTSMKCLDEGVDVPRSELAIFCASTGNPRQFIQRRGRILRTHPEKKIAIIHDLVVIPKIRESSPSYKMEQSLLKAELKRVSNFAMLSENSSEAQMELFEVMNYYGLNLFNNDHI